MLRAATVTTRLGRVPRRRPHSAKSRPGRIPPPPTCCCTCGIIQFVVGQPQAGCKVHPALLGCHLGEYWPPHASNAGGWVPRASWGKFLGDVMLLLIDVRQLVGRAAIRKLPHPEGNVGSSSQRPSRHIISHHVGRTAHVTVGNVRQLSCTLLHCLQGFVDGSLAWLLEDASEESDYQLQITEDPHWHLEVGAGSGEVGQARECLAAGQGFCLIVGQPPAEPTTCPHNLLPMGVYNHKPPRAYPVCAPAIKLHMRGRAHTEACTLWELSGGGQRLLCGVGCLLQLIILIWPGCRVLHVQLWWGELGGGCH